MTVLSAPPLSTCFSPIFKMSVLNGLPVTESCFQCTWCGHVTHAGPLSLSWVFLHLEPGKASLFLCGGEGIKCASLGALWPHLQAHEQSLSLVGRMERILRKAEVTDKEEALAAALL